MSDVSIVHVDLTLNGVHVLKDVSLEVRSGEVACIVGRSGAGKSSLLRCINALTMPNRGCVLLDGEPVGRRVHGGVLHDLKESEVSRQRRRMGLVSQDYNIFPHLNVLDNLMLAPTVLRLGKKSELKERAMHLLEKVGMAHRAQAFSRELSGGEQQRVAIARSLMLEPKLMLFDEPTSALDPELTEEVLRAMRDLAKDGMTMIIVSHEVDFVRSIAQRVVLMSAGAVVEDAPADEFFRSPQTSEAREYLGMATA